MGEMRSFVENWFYHAKDMMSIQKELVIFDDGGVDVAKLKFGENMLVLVLTGNVMMSNDAMFLLALNSFGHWRAKIWEADIQDGISI